MGYDNRNTMGMVNWNSEGALIQLNIEAGATRSFAGLFGLFSSNASIEQNIKREIITKEGIYDRTLEDIPSLQRDFDVSFVPNISPSGYLVKCFYGIEECLTADLRDGLPTDREVYNHIRGEIGEKNRRYQARYQDVNQTAEVIISWLPHIMAEKEHYDPIYDTVCELYFYTHPTKENNPFLHCFALSMAGVLSQKYYKSGENVVFHHQAQRMLQSLPETGLHMQVHYNAAAAYHTHTNDHPSDSHFQRAHQSYQMALHYAVNQDDHLLQFLSHLGMADTWFHMGRATEAKEELNSCKEMLQMDGKITQEEHRLFEAIHNYESDIRLANYQRDQIKARSDQLYAALFSIFSNVLPRIFGVLNKGARIYDLRNSSLSASIMSIGDNNRIFR